MTNAVNQQQVLTWNTFASVAANPVCELVALLAVQLVTGVTALRETIASVVRVHTLSIIADKGVGRTGTVGLVTVIRAIEHIILKYKYRDRNTIF